MAQTSFSFEGLQGTAGRVARLARAVPGGHYDELRLPGEGLRPAWEEFFTHLGPTGFADLDRRAATVARQIRDDGVTYNVYSDEDGPQRAWSVELLPFIIPADEWTTIEAGVAQRARLLSAIMADVYGEQRLLHEGLLPPALVLGSPGYLRPLRDVRPPGEAPLHIVAFDLARGPDGGWWVVSQRTQAPSGLGYLLQNRLIVSRLFPDAFREMRVQRLASSYRQLLDTLYTLCPRDGGSPPRIVLLTPGPYNETYFEHAYLARYLGTPLVEGSDLTVRNDQVFLKTLHGLERVHGILRRLDDDFCDPVELRPDSTLGVPGLLQACRAGQVVVANALGSGFLESPALNGFLPAIAERLLGEPPSIPSLPSWWCGEAAALAEVAPQLARKVVKPTHPGAGFEPVISDKLGPDGLQRLRLRIEADPAAFTVQEYLPLSQAPTWRSGAVRPRGAMVRVFAVADGSGGWQTMPGALTRIAGRAQLVVSMQHGGSSMDTWVQTSGAVDTFSMLPHALRPRDLAGQRRPVTSRTAENLFWMGRYTERADFTTRLARSALRLLADRASGPPPVYDGLARLCTQHGLVPASVPPPQLSAAVFERTLIAGLADARSDGVGFNLDALRRTAGQIRDRLSPEHSRLITAAEAAFTRDCAAASRDGAFSSDEAVAALSGLGVWLSAITGAQSDRMTRDDGWRLLTVGRQIERLTVLSGSLHVLFSSRGVVTEEGFDLLLRLFDSMITYRSLYQRRVEVPPLLALLVQDQANPRALACVAAGLRAELLRIPGPGADDLLALAPAPETWPGLGALCEHEGGYACLLELTQRLRAGARSLSEVIGARFFSHAASGYHWVRA